MIYVPVIDVVQGAAAFNYFFTLVLWFGVVAFGINLLIRMFTRS